jgi:flagellar assembly factor FliW
MAVAETAHFGTIDYAEESVIEFPQGIPAFEREHRFLLIQRESSGPVVFLQSLRHPDLLFLTLPVRVVEPGYRGCIAGEDLERLGLAADRQPEEGREVLTLVLLTIGQDGSAATANLMAPVVINLATRRALQSVQPDSGYPVAVRLRRDDGMTGKET